MPRSPCGTRKDVSLTSRAFSPKIARNNFSSALNSVSPFGVILPTKISPGTTWAPIRIIPSSSRSLKISSPILGISLVISSGPNLVSRASISNFSICIEVKRSSLTIASESIIASSKLNPYQLMKATLTFWPSANFPSLVEVLSANKDPSSTWSPTKTIGLWLIQVPWLLLTNFLKG